MQLSPNKVEQVSFTSLDAPPLDFSFKNIKDLDQLKATIPRKGQRKLIQTQDQKAKNKGQQQIQQDNKNIDKQTNNLDNKSDKKKVQVTRLLPENNINNVVSTMVTASNLKNISNKAKQELQKKKAKIAQIKLVCCSLMLSYNKIRLINNLEPVLSVVMENHLNLQWIDISHNYIQHLNYHFEDFIHLKTIYLHCNYIYDINQLAGLNKLKELRSFTIHGNPLTSIQNFRIFVIGVLQTIKKLDSVLISKKQRDNAIFLCSQIKKFPIPKNITKAPDQKKEEQEQKDNSA